MEEELYKENKVTVEEIKKKKCILEYYKKFLHRLIIKLIYIKYVKISLSHAAQLPQWTE